MPEDPRPELAARDEAVAQELRDMATFLLNVEHTPADRPGLRYAAWLLHARADGIEPLPPGALRTSAECTHGGDCPLPGHPNALHGHLDVTDWAGHMRAGSARMLAIDAWSAALSDQNARIRAGWQQQSEPAREPDATGHLGRAAQRVRSYLPPGCTPGCMWPVGKHLPECWSSRPADPGVDPCPDCRQPARAYGTGSIIHHSAGCQASRDDTR